MRKPPKRRSRGSDGPGSAQEESVLSKRAVPLTAAMRQAACAHTYEDDGTLLLPDPGSSLFREQAEA